ncbi:uncharacterized protein C18orf8-like [Mizuhopecten yessoensis]|uniref:Uncharacterized protein C18orf8 n=1 Tax=Mizuhopecten yessoensis TaxID=6573 RepID=A0A210QEG1_MIZYE|nr:uncharacterized protein C18orf8-like [Mizuhopecten yessoensis]OWF47157.1 Uncharacterized protein C18orf8 [Mizuhopecten yessoensis]
MAEADDSNFYIELCKTPIRFDPVDKVTNVFYDDSNKQVFAVRSGGAMGVVVKGPGEKDSVTFRVEGRGDVISIKFSPDKRVLGIQRSAKSVEFINFMTDMTADQLEYSQTCKGKSTNIMGFVWTGVNEIVFVTDHGIEFYQVTPEKRLLKCAKTINLSVAWFVWQNNPYIIFQGTMTKLPKFEVDLPAVQKQAKTPLLERDVIMAIIYGQLYIVILRHQPRPGSIGAEIVLYQIIRDGPARKTNVLKLDMSGRFAINIVDNLILVHHQASRTSVVFDILLEGESDGFVTFHYPVVSPLPIKPFTMLLPSLNLQTGANKMEYSCELYSPNWIVFQPNIIIDAKLGCLWYVKLLSGPLVVMIPDKCRLIKFLLQRNDSKADILSVCRNMMVPGKQANLRTIASVLDMLNKVYHSHLESEINQLATDTQARPLEPRRRQVIIDQSDAYTHIFSIFEDRKDMKYKFIVAVLIEYIRSLNQHNIPVQHYLYELIINTLVHNNCCYQLHQFLQYHVLSDSKPLACLMLSLESVYPPAHQLALDMLKRLSTANEEIIEVLLSKQQLLPALRFIRSVGITDTVSARKFLEAAKSTENNMLFYTVFKFFEQRNIRLRNHPKFPQGEHCEQYTKYFEGLFGTDALAQMFQT